MANTPKPKSSFITDVLAFVTDKKKLPLLLLLLGGSATVVTTTAVLLSNPGNNASSSQGGSTGPISGNDVPTLDFGNATLNPSGSGIGASFDFNWMSRYQNDFYLQSGRNYFDGADPTLGDQHTENAFAIYNFRTGEIIFEYTFDLGAAERSAILAGTSNNYWGELRMAFDGESTAYLLIDSRFSSTIGGSYTPMKNYVTTKFGSFNGWDNFQFLLAFDIEDTTSFTILDARKSTSDFYANDMLFENDRLYLGTSFRKAYLENSVSRDENNVFDFITIPTEIPSLTLVDSNPEQRLGYLIQLSVEGTTLTTLESTPIASNYNSNLWFQGYRQGFETRYFTEEGHMVINANFWNNNNNINGELDISTFFDNLETTFLDDNLTVLNEAETKTLAAYDAIIDTPNGDSFTSYSFGVNLNGFFNFETGKFEHAFAGYNVYAYNYNAGQEQRAESYSWPQLFLTDSGDSFLIDNETVSTWENDGTQRVWSQLNPDHLVSSVSTLYSYDLETGEKTSLLANNNNGTVINGVFKKSDGYYLTGSYYETDNNEVESVDAFLRATTASFGIQQELVLAGTKDDMGQTIMLDGSGRPVWMVTSNSSDGDFAGLGGTENRFTTYSVSF